MLPVDGTVWTASSRALLNACGRLGVDVDALLRASGLSRRTLEDPDARLNNRDVRLLWTKAHELSGDPVLSLHAAEACPLGAYKVIDYIAGSASTVGEAFRWGARYARLINTAVTFAIDDSGDPVRLEVVADDGEASLSREYTEFVLTAAFLHVRGATGVPFSAQRATFTHRRPPDVREHERIFGGAVQFEAPATCLFFERSVWERPTRGANPGVFRLLLEHADLLIARLPQRPDLVERARRAIARQLRAEGASLASVAHELGMGERTLQRRLCEVGCSFNDLVDEVRQVLVRLYLDQPDIGIAEIACLLGFADQSAFSRAFKRWTGSTPAEARRTRGAVERR